MYWGVVKIKKWRWLLTFFLYGSGTALFSVLEPMFLKWIIDLINSGVPGADGIWEQLVKLVGFAVFNIFLYNALFRVADYFVVSLEADGMRVLSDMAFRNLRQHSYGFFANEFVGSLVAKTKRYVQAFETIMDQIIYKFWLDGIKVIGVFAVTFFLDPFIAYVFLGWTVVYVFVSYKLIKWKAPTDIVAAKADSKVTAHFADVLTNILNLKIFSKEKSEQKLFEGRTDDQYRKRLKSWRRQNVQWVVNSLMMLVLNAGGLFYSLYMWNEGLFSAGTVVLLQTYFTQINYRLWELGRAMMMFTKAIADGNEMIEIFDKEHEVKDVSRPISCGISKGEIEFKDVIFTYNGEREVFRGFDLKIKSGEKVGLVGHSGAGKSTLTKLLLRFLDVQGGEVLIDGCDISKIRQSELREKISYVPQDPVLFHRSLEENIAYARPDVGRDELIEVSKKAHCYEFIKDLKDGFDTFVGERGIKLSGGERQRVAIARAMLEDAPIVILDEATSSLDSVSEVLIQEAFEELMKGKTAIVIAHRLSTIKKMDRILVMDDGEIVEEGTHDELLKKSGAYAELWAHQTGGFLGE